MTMWKAESKEGEVEILGTTCRINTTACLVLEVLTFECPLGNELVVSEKAVHEDSSLKPLNLVFQGS